MKRLTALLMSIMMLATLAVGASAEGEILFMDNFNGGFLPDNWILEGNEYFLDDVTDDSNPCLAAYNNGVVCQMEFREENTGVPKRFTNCAVAVDMQARDFDSDGDHAMGLWWRDDFAHTPDGEEPDHELGEVYNVKVDLDNLVIKLIVEIPAEEGDGVLAEAPIPSGVEVGGDWFTLGWKITSGNMKCYINNQCLIDYSDDEISAAYDSPILLLNDGCYAAYDNIIVATIDYNLFNEDLGEDPVVTEPSDDPVASETEPSDDPAASETEPSDDPAATEPEATTAIETEIVTNEDGETEVVTHIVTEEKKPEADDNDAENKPAPDTNTGKPTGGNSTTTGDISFVVVLAMVTALGAALIVRKVSVR